MVVEEHVVDVVEVDHSLWLFAVPQMWADLLGLENDWVLIG